MEARRNKKELHYPGVPRLHTLRPTDAQHPGLTASFPCTRASLAARLFCLALDPPPLPRRQDRRNTTPAKERIMSDGQENRPLAVTRGTVSRDRGDGARRAPARTIVDPRTGQAPTILRPHHTAPIAVRSQRPYPLASDDSTIAKVLAPVCPPTRSTSMVVPGSFVVLNSSLHGHPCPHSRPSLHGNARGVTKT